jgi:drug/metabolite transporter (DMT)-like permease
VTADRTGAQPHRRTVAEAIAQADAKDRVRTARGVRGGGIGLAMIGVALLTRPSTWRPYSQAVGVHIHGGPSFTLSFQAVLGILAVVVGPFVIAAGHWLLIRAIDAARRDPITAPIFDQTEP